MKKNFISKVIIISIIVLLCACGSDKSIEKTVSYAEKKHGDVIEKQSQIIDELQPENESGQEIANEEFKETPCRRIEYFVPPGSSRDIKFSRLSAKDGSMEQWEFTKNEAEKHNVIINLTEVTSESVPINIWVLQDEGDHPVIPGVATISKNTLIMKMEERTFAVLMLNMEISDYVLVQEHEVLEKLNNFPNIRKALDNGAVYLSRDNHDFYINTFHLNVEVPKDKNERWLNGLNIFVEREDATDNQMEKSIKGLKPSLKILLQRYSGKGNYCFSGPVDRPSCFEY